jgi:hypothetical protein
VPQAEEDIPIEFDLIDEHAAADSNEISDSEFEVLTEGPVATTRLDDHEVAAVTEEPEVEVSWEAVSFDGIDSSPKASTQAFERGLENQDNDDASLDEDYVAFADVEDDAEESLEGWGDVLVETADALGVTEAPPVAEKKAPPPAVTWADVINAARAAAKLSPKPAAAPVEVAGTMVDETELFLDSLDATDPQVRRESAQRLLASGPGADDGVRTRFPGNVGFDPLDPAAKVPPFARCSGLCEFLAARGVSGAHLVLPFLDDENPVKRFFAIYFLLAVPYPPALEGLARRLYDTEPRCRHLAADTLRLYAHVPGYERILEAVRGQLRLPVIEARVAAVQLLGQLRDPASVPELIPLILAPEAVLVRAATSALAVICGQEYGSNISRWSEWWQQNYNRPRPVWLLQGLRHQNPEIRRVANYELQLLTGLTTQFNADAPEADREARVRMWENWWAREVSARTTAQTAAS